MQCQNMNMSYVKCIIYILFYKYLLLCVLWNSLPGMFIKIPTVQYCFSKIKKKKKYLNSETHLPPRVSDKKPLDLNQMY